MQIDFIKSVSPGAAPVWLAYDTEKTDSFSRLIASGRYTFDETARFIRRYFATIGGGEFIDVGAHFGIYTVAVASLGTVSVTAFEALPDNYVILSEAVRRNGFHNVRCIHAAIGSEIGVTHVAGDSAWGHVADAGIATPGLTIDHVCDLHRAFVTGLLKIDVEGYEFNVLKGAIRTLDRCLGLDVVVEIFPENKRSLSLLEDLGFHCYMLKLGSLIPASSGDFQEQQVTDYFCTRRELSGESFAATPVVAKDMDLSASLIETEASLLATDHRVSIARRLRYAPDALRSHPTIVQVTKRLRDDPDARVRVALSEWL